MGTGPEGTLVTLHCGTFGCPLPVRAEVLARSTNGGFSVRVPEGESYFVDIRTTNGELRSDVESDRTADRIITAETTNGGIAVEHTG